MAIEEIERFIFDLINSQITVMNYWKIDAFCFTLGFTFCLLSLYEIKLVFFICSVIWIWVYPIVL